MMKGETTTEKITKRGKNNYSLFFDNKRFHKYKLSLPVDKRKQLQIAHIIEHICIILLTLKRKNVENRCQIAASKKK